MLDRALIKQIESALGKVKDWQSHKIPHEKANRSFIGSHSDWCFTILDYSSCLLAEDFDGEIFEGVVVNSRKGVVLRMPYPVARKAAVAALRKIGTN